MAVTPAPTPALDRAAVEEAKGKFSVAERKAIREAARREVKDEERARLAASSKGGRPAPAAAPAVAPAAGLPPAEVERSDAQWAADVAVFLRGVLFPVLGLLAGLFGYTLAPLPDAAAKDDASAWLPVVRRYSWARWVVTWAAVPARVIARTRDLAAKREAPPAEGAK